MRLMSAPRARVCNRAVGAVGALVLASGLLAGGSVAHAQSQTVDFGPQLGGATGADVAVSVAVPVGAVLSDGATLTLSSQGDIDSANGNPTFDELLTVQAGATTLTSFRVPIDCVVDPAGSVDTRAIAIPGPTLAAAVSGGSLTLNFVTAQGVDSRCPGGGVFAGLGPFNLAVAGSVAFSVPDTTPPAAPTIDLAATSDTGVSDGDDLTSVTTPTIEGAAEANATVTIRNGATVVATTTADGSGAFSAATTTLPEGASTLTATATDAAGNESAASAGLAVTIDTTRPGVTVSDPASGTRGGPFDLTITFTEDATGFTQGDVSVSNGTVTNLVGGPQVFTASINPTATGTTTVSVAADAATDAAGNGNTASNNFDVAVDLTPPSAPTLDLAAGSDTGIDDADDLTSDTTPTIEGTAEANATVTIRNGSTVVAATTADGVGAFSVVASTLPEGAAALTATATDAVGNESAASAPLNLTIDTSPPGVTVSDPASGVRGAPFDLTITFDEDVVGFVQNDVSVSNGTITNLVGGPRIFTATIDPTATGTTTVSVAAAVATDAAGNDNTASNNFDVAVDLTPPDAPTIDLAAGSDTGISDSDDVTSATTPTIQGTAEANATVTIRADGTAVVATTTADGSGNYSVATSALPEGLSTLTATATDAVGNESAASTGLAVTIDTARPAVTVSDPAGGVRAAPFDLTITFDEDVNGFVQGDVSVSNGTITNLVGGPQIFTATINPTATGVVSVSVPADAATDAAGNGNAASNTLAVGSDVTPPDAPTLDLTAGSDTGAADDDDVTAATEPTIEGTAETGATVTIRNGATVVATTTATAGAFSVTTSTLPEGAVALTATATDAVGNESAASAPLNLTIDATRPGVVVSDPAGGVRNAPFDVAITFDEDVDGFVQGDVSVLNGTVTNLVGGPQVFTATINPTATGTVSVSVAENVALDLAGNGNTASNSLAVAADITPPDAPTLDLAAGSDTGASDADDVTADATPTIEGTAEANALVTIRSGAATVATATADGSGAFAATTSPLPEGAVSLTATATDAVGNEGPASAALALTIDTGRPGVTVSDPAGGVRTGAFDLTITFDEDVSGFVQGDVSASNASVTNLVGGPRVFTATIAPATDGTVSVSVAENLAEDLAGNGNTASNSLDVQADVTAPTVVVSGPTTVQTGPFTVDFAFSEPVDMFVAGDVSVGNGALSGFSGSGDSYSATITPNASGAVTVSVAAAMAEDAAGNPNEASNLFSVNAALEGTVTIVATTGPAAAGDASFAYASSDPAFDGITLATVGNTAQAGPATLTQGLITVTQTAPEGFRLAAITCVGDSDLGSVATLASATVDIDLDALEAITCTFENVRDEEFVQTVTSAAITGFMATRADRILAEGPRFTDRFRRDGVSAEGGLDVSARDGAFDASFSASLVGAAAANMEAGGGPSGVAALDALKRRDFTSGFDVWVQGAYASVDEDRADTDITSRFGVVHLGVDKLVTPNVILGVTAQVDFQQSDIGAFGSEVDGVGFLVGPYVAAKFGESLFAEARGAWGQSYNDINPFGSYEDEFETDRFLVEGRVVGSHEVGGFRVAPEVGVAFFRETQDSYVDSLGIVIPENRISIGRVTFGPEVSYRLENAHHGVFLEPFARVQGSWDFIGAEVGTASGGQTTLDDIRADLAFGATARSEGGTTLRGEVGFDGVLLEDSSAVSGQIELRIPLGGD